MDALHLSAGRWAYREKSELNDFYVTGRNKIRDSAAIIYSGKKNIKGSSEPIFKGILVIENEMGPTGLKPILFNKLLLTVSNWF